MRNIKQNLFFAFLYNTLGVPIAAGVLYPFFGLLLSPMIAAAAMSLQLGIGHPSSSHRPSSSGKPLLLQHTGNQHIGIKKDAHVPKLRLRLQARRPLPG
jgi:hypothetical protein